MVSIKDIAKKCNVSVATVSKALNNQKDIGSATKARIIKVAEDMGYMANVSARALKTNRTYSIGVLFKDSEPGLSNEYFTNVLDGFKSEAEDHGYNISFINDLIAGKKASYRKHCEYRKYDGVAIICADFESKDIIDLTKSSIPVVSLDYQFENCSSIMSNNYDGMVELVEYAIKMGHRRIAYIHGKSDKKVTNARLSSFYGALRKNNIDIPNEYVLESRYHNIKLTNDKLNQLLKLKNYPTCIFFPDDYTAIGCIQTILSSKKKVSFAGYDGIEMARTLGLTTYQQDKESLGRMAAKKLIEQIEDQNVIKENIIVTGNLLKGKSIKRNRIQ
ncbi:MAG: LacI family DNA-binding transcriptional regulator [Erysipelotrichaceae bacterium]|nr:LacI family DNA-binding transcriptional regulator [Erysipelotrichaceae bacterium]